jgi:predicted nucleotidyltransferase
LFGSRARKTAQEGADIDIAIDSKSLINLNKILDIYGEIEESTIPVKVDIIDFRNVSNEMKKEIERDGILWTK